MIFQVEVEPRHPQYPLDQRRAKIEQRAELVTAHALFLGDAVFQYLEVTELRGSLQLLVQQREGELVFARTQRRIDLHVVDVSIHSHFRVDFPAYVLPVHLDA